MADRQREVGVKMSLQVKYNILDYILQQTGSKPKRQGDKYLIDPCPRCRHFGHFYIYPKTQSYYSFANCCNPTGGSLVDAIMLFEGISLAEAMRRVHGDEPPPDKQKENEIKKLASLLNEQVEGFFNACTAKYKLLKDTEKQFAECGIDWTDPYYRWIRQGVRFYDRVTTEFIEADYAKRVQLMRNHNDEYFFKLCPEVVAIERI